jgi:hypothetical protein
VATRRYGISAGETLNQVTEAVGAAVAADGVELTVDLAAAGMTTASGRERVMLAIEAIKCHIMKGNWPPA